LRKRAAQARDETFALYLACRDPRVPWYAKLAAGAVVAYALSPIDLIPDFIPLLGYLDDLILIPAGVFLVAKMVPPAMMLEHRAASKERLAGRGLTWAGAGIVLVLWLIVAAVLLLAVFR
jgi:uncharacterized membrane protein YkvA (DUF1232 family)